MSKTYPGTGAVSDGCAHTKLLNAVDDVIRGEDLEVVHRVLEIHLVRCCMVAGITIGMELDRIVETNEALMNIPHHEHPSEKDMLS